MIRTDDARREILKAIRENLARGSSPHDPRPAPPSSPPAPLSVPERGDVLRVRTFTERLAAVGAQCTVVSGEAEAGGALAGILSGAGARRVAGSDAPLVQRLLRPLRDRFEIADLEGLSRDDLFACDVGVTTAQWGIAETGTLVLESARERSRLRSHADSATSALTKNACTSTHPIRIMTSA